LGEGQTLLGWTVVFVDVTVQKRDSARALEAERVQAQFLATVSHELRTPLTVVNGALGLLKMNPSKLTAEKTEHLVSLALKIPQFWRRWSMTCWIRKNWKALNSH
jgi:K+-sensing histidine kinase KdpD